MQSVRSGSHLEQIGETWYYRRVVPPDARRAFGKTKVRFSLRTKSHTEAKRLEKDHDVAFEKTLRHARTTDIDGYSKDPAVRLEQLTERIFTGQTDEDPDAAYLMIPKRDWAAVERNIERLGDEQIEWEVDADRLLTEMREILALSRSLDTEGPEILDLVKSHLLSLRTQHTIDWAYQQWLRSKSRPQQTQDDASRYLDDFKKSAKVRMLAAVRRRHMTDWRTGLQAVGDLGSTSINHRLEIVSAILRVGWREAEIPAADLERINLPESGTSGRTSWSRDEVLHEMNLLVPRSWAAWLYIIALTTGSRIGEPVAARKEWYDPLGFITVPAQFTKMKKPHVMPIIELIRPSLEAHQAELACNDFLFDAPRPSNPNLKMSHEVSKWFSRLHKKHEIPKVIHELRHTWIEAARESPIKKEIYEIISGHSPKTVSDKYGGAKPSELLAANEKICATFLDAHMSEAIGRLIA